MSIDAHAASDADFDSGHENEVKAASLSSKGKGGGILYYIPIFFWVALVSIVLRIIEATFGLSLIRENLIPWSSQWSINTIELLLYLLAMFAPQEVYRVSRPGVDQSVEVWLIIALGGFQLMAFVLGTFADIVNVVPWLQVFATTENLGFGLITIACSYYTYRTNVRSMQRSFVHGG